MSSIKGFLGRGLLLHIGSFVGFSISILLAPIVILIGPVRELIFTISLKNKIWEKDFPNQMKGVLLIFYFQIAIGVPGIAVTYLGIEHLFDGIVTAGLLIVFFAFQYPRMLPSYFCALFTTVTMDNKKFSKSVEAATEIDLFFCITNLGLTYLKNCFCSIEFEEGFQIKGSPDYVCGVTSDYRRIQFSPDKFFFSLPPFTYRQLIVRVKTAKKPGKYKVKIGLDSESTWGTAEKTLHLLVTEK